jgi:glycosyltransferase involved in cell wall biosynthesis
MNILELCLSPDFGGLEIHMRDFSRWLAEKPGIQLFLVLQENTRLQQDLENLAVPMFKFSSRAGKFSPVMAWRLSNIIRENHINVLHVHWKFDLPLVALIKKICKQPFKFVHTRQMNMPGTKRDPYHRFIYGRMDCFIAITKYIEKQAQENLPIDHSKIKQIYYGVQPSPEITAQHKLDLKKRFKIQGDFTIGLLGRISEYKGQHILIQAVEILKTQGIHVKAWIVGEAFEKEYKSKLESMVLEKGLSDQIFFMNFYEKPLELMSCFDTVVLTTKKETFGLVLIEAMHAGVAVIGSDAGGVLEIIDHEKTGMLFESWNAEALAESIKRLVIDSDLRKNLARAGQIKALEKFNLEEQYQKVLDTIIGLFC